MYRRLCSYVSITFMLSCCFYIFVIYYTLFSQINKQTTDKRLIDWFIDLMSDWLIGWSIDWSIDWLIIHLLIDSWNVIFHKFKKSVIICNTCRFWFSELVSIRLWEVFKTGQEPSEYGDIYERKSLCLHTHGIKENPSLPRSHTRFYHTKTAH